MDKAVGLLEVLGYSVALVAMDKACKASEITIEGIECNNPSQGDAAQIPVVVQVKFTGGIDEVKVALEVAYEEARKYINQEDIMTHLIPRSMNGIKNLLPIGKVKLK